MRKRLNITLSESVMKTLENLSTEMGLSKSAVIAVALENFKKEREK